MSRYRTKKKRRRARIRRWEKRLKKAAKRSLMRSIIEDLEHASILLNYEDAIKTEYKLGEVDGFRWVHNPLEDIDSLPQKFQNPDFKEEDIELPPDDASEEAIKEFINSDYFTLSHYETAVQAEVAYSSSLKDRLDKVKGKTEQTKEARRKRVTERFKAKKGEYIQKVHYRYGDALIGKVNESGHFNVLPRKGLTINDVIDLTYKPHKIVINYDRA